MLSSPKGIDKPSSTELYYQKLGAQLLFLYQAYLLGETELVPELKVALWRLGTMDTDMGTKIRMVRMELLKLELASLEDAWDDTAESLFPPIESNTSELTEEKAEQIAGYKESALQLLEAGPR